jgi:hypothetical protein
MLRRLALSGTLAVVSLTVIAIAPASTAAPPTLKGTDGPSFTISLKRNGKTVKSLVVARYKFVVSDKSSAHGFTLEQVKGGKWEKKPGGGAIRRYEEHDRRAQAGQVEVLLPSSRRRHVRLLHRQVVGRRSVLREWCLPSARRAIVDTLFGELERLD